MSVSNTCFGDSSTWVKHMRNDKKKAHLITYSDGKLSHASAVMFLDGGELIAYDNSFLPPRRRDGLAGNTRRLKTKWQNVDGKTEVDAMAVIREIAKLRLEAKQRDVVFNVHTPKWEDQP